MFRRMITAAVAVSAVAALAACTSDGGDKSQSPSSPDTTPSVSTSAPTSSTPSTPASTAAPTPTGFGAAQPAVDAYVGYQNLVNQGLRAPAKFAPASAARLSAGQAMLVLTGAVADELKQGKVYRGTPWERRIKVVKSELGGTLPSVVMTDCPLPNASWTEYVAATGKKVPTVQRKVPPPYLATIKAFQPNKKSWVITSYTLDGSKTCSR